MNGTSRSVTTSPGVIGIVVVVGVEVVLTEVVVVEVVVEVELVVVDVAAVPGTATSADGDRHEAAMSIRAVTTDSRFMEGGGGYRPEPTTLLVTMRVWMQIGSRHAEPGYHAWCLDHLGFATWAPTEEEVLGRLPAKFDEYRLWVDAHGLGEAEPDPGIEVVEEVRGNEVLFDPDRDPASPAEIDRAIALLAASRSDLEAVLSEAPSEAVDWDPPYERFAPWADWRTIRASLAHLANGETHYYTAMIGHTSGRAPASPKGDWQEFLPETRAEAIAFLRDIQSSNDLARVGEQDVGYGVEAWSVRKALRRMVRHELLHTKSVRRILREFGAS